MAADGTLLILDQHAAHERVRLEQLTAQLQARIAASSVGNNNDSGTGGRESSGGGGGGSSNGPAAEVLGCQQLPKPLQLQLATMEAATLVRHKKLISAWGWRLRPVGGVRTIKHKAGDAVGGAAACGGGGGNTSTWLGVLDGGAEEEEGAAPLGPLQHVVSGEEATQLLAGVPCVYGTLLSNPTDLRVYLHQLHETGGAALLPPAVLRVLRSKACRSAVMFGDQLAPEECVLLLGQLRRTALWTQCAHGRPTVAPLVHVPTLR
ncbi:hypothetical protein Agub_g12593, partial [Astrephomene gubernaculifera]